MFCDEQEIMISKLRFDFLRVLLEQRGKYVKKQQVLSRVYAATDTYAYQNINSLKAQIKKDCISWGLSQNVIEYDKLSDQYRILVYKIEDDEESSDNAVDSNIYFLTNTSISNATTETVICREKELDDVLEYFRRQKHNRSVLIYGFGGVGKTSFVRLLYTYLQEEIEYDYVAIMNYHVNLVTSMVESIELEEYNDETMTENDVDKKWKSISKLLRNSSKRKLFIIDNVDYDYDLNQDPLSAKEIKAFAELSGWKNTDVIITSRISDLGSSFYPYEMNNLGNERGYDNCISLFLHYNRKLEDNSGNRNIITKLIEMANYNTMVIELLARSSINVSSINDFYNNLVRVGFEYSNIPVSTMHDGEKETVKNQLLKLFEMKKRNDIERMILWDFHALPEGTKVSENELTNWLGYKPEEIVQLIDEGWIQFVDGRFSLHPLIRQAIKNDETEWKKQLQKRTVMFRERDKSLVEKINDKSFFSEDDDFEEGIRKLIFADAILYHGKYQSDEELVYMADIARRRGVRAMGVMYYKAVYDRRKEDLTLKSIDDIRLLWRATYFYGYMLSYTRAGMDQAEQLLRESLEITELFYAEEHFYDEYLVYIATSMDHLGYVLSNLGRNDIRTITEADYYLREACGTRSLLCHAYPHNFRMLHDFAWSLDNLGALYAYLNIDEIDYDDNSDDLLTKEDLMNAQQESKYYLRISLNYRKSFSELRHNPDSTEVAWTCCNLANLLTNTGDYLEAEALLKEALGIYHNLEQKFPGQHSSSEARTCSAYARLLEKIPERENDAIRLYNKALESNLALEKEHPGTYSVEIENLRKRILEMRG